MKIRAMLSVLIVAILTINFSLAAPADTRRESHPRILTKQSKHSEIVEKVENSEWAKKLYESYKKDLKVYVERHKTDPDWILSRCQMHWEEGKRFTDKRWLALKDQETDWAGLWKYIGSGNAPAPTIRGENIGPRTASNGEAFLNPKLEDIEPYSDGVMLLKTRSGFEEIANAGPFASQINTEMLHLAIKAATIYWVEGDEDYGKFASDIIYLFLNGMSYMNMPEGHSVTGFIEPSALADGTIWQRLVFAYDIAFDYLAANPDKYDIERAETAIQKLGFSSVYMGMGSGNFVPIETLLRTFCALTLESDNFYVTGPGREFLMDFVLKREWRRRQQVGEEYSENFDFWHQYERTSAPITMSLNTNYNKDGIWDETFSYHYFPTYHMYPLVLALENNGHDIFKEYPALYKAAYMPVEFVFPDYTLPMLGDRNVMTPAGSLIEAAIGVARENGDPIEEKLTKYLKLLIKKGLHARGNTFHRTPYMPIFTYVGELMETDELDEYSIFPRADEIDFAGLSLQRNLAADYKNSLMYTVYGAPHGHGHGHGMTIELYGKGYVQSRDWTNGEYWTPAKLEFCDTRVAHNTVVCDGKSDKLMKDSIEVVNIEPKAKTSVAVSEKVSFTDTSYYEYLSDADQRRLVSIIRTSDESGYYVDIFRSKKREVAAEKHDYIYNNIGQSVDITDTKLNALALTESDYLNSKTGDAKGYDWFENEKSVQHTGDFIATFNVERKNAEPVYMRQWALDSGAERTIFDADTEHIYNYPANVVKEGNRHSVVIRQQGDAWDSPFVNVFEPFEAASDIESVQKIAESKADSMQALSVISEINGSTHKQTIISNTTATQKHKVADFQFKGIYAVISSIDDEFEYMYMGAGNMLSSNEITIESETDELIAANITKAGEARYSISTDGDCYITIGDSLVADKDVYLTDSKGNKNRISQKTGLFSSGNQRISINAGYDYTLTIE